MDIPGNLPPEMIPSEVSAPPIQVWATDAPTFAAVFGSYLLLNRYAYTYKQESMNEADKNQESLLPDNGKEQDKPPSPQSDGSDTASLVDARSTIDEEFPVEEQNVDDLLKRIPTMYRLLDLWRETGSGGLGGLGEMFS
ncbi:hypothetical protein BDV93DRAFT_355701, partial [Ceratobasidium sp. AG-I]